MKRMVQDKINKSLRDAILDGDLEKTRKFLNAPIMKPDIHSITEREKGGFSMLHCAVLSGNHQIIIMLLQMDINHMLLTSDGYSALDLALWKGQYEIADMLRKEGLIAPMKEPESLNGRKIIYRGQRATVVKYVDDPAECSNGLRRPTKMRQLIVEETGNEILVNCWTGLDYQLESSSTKHNQYTITNTSPSMITSPSAHILSPVSSSILSETFPEEDEEEDEEEEDDDPFAQVVEVQASAGPLGLLLDAMILDAAVVNGFKKLENGSKGDIERSTLVKPRMMIIGINDIDVSKKSLLQITQLLQEYHQDEKRMFFSFRRSSPKWDNRHRPVVPQNKTEATDNNNQTEDDLALVSKLPKKCPYCQLPTHTMEVCPYK